MEELKNDPLLMTALNSLELKTKNENKLWYGENITNDKIKNLFYGKFYSDVEYETYKFCSRLDTSKYGDYTFSGYIDNDPGFGISNLEILNIDFLSKIHIHGKYDVQFEAVVMGKNPDPNLNEEEFFAIDMIEFYEKATFSITINEKHEYEAFKIGFNEIEKEQP